ncbi:MAG TPA: YjbQ family protein, partial [Gammaproteobacteria bacterium]
MVFQRTLAFETHGRGTSDITAAVQEAVGDAGIDAGLCNLFIHHTSASLLLTENADSQVRRDLETFLARLVPDGDPMFGHDDEGPDDMP